MISSLQNINNVFFFTYFLSILEFTFHRYLGAFLGMWNITKQAFQFNNNTSCILLKLKKEY